MVITVSVLVSMKPALGKGHRIAFQREVRANVRVHGKGSKRWWNFRTEDKRGFMVEAKLWL